MYYNLYFISREKFFFCQLHFKKPINKIRKIPLVIIDFTSEPTSKHKRYYEMNRESIMIRKKSHYQKLKKTILLKSESNKTLTAFIANSSIDENLIEENNVRDRNLSKLTNAQRIIFYTALLRVSESRFLL